MIPEKYRSMLFHMRGVTSDVSGEEVLVGLNAAETAEYFQHVENPDPDNQKATKRYLELHERHAAARLDGESRRRSFRGSLGELPPELPGRHKNE